jgi:hypothetical protein
VHVLGNQCDDAADASLDTLQLMVFCGPGGIVAGTQSVQLAHRIEVGD